MKEQSAKSSGRSFRDTERLSVAERLLRVSSRRQTLHPASSQVPRSAIHTEQSNQRDGLQSFRRVRVRLLILVRAQRMSRFGSKACDQMLSSANSSFFGIPRKSARPSLPLGYERERVRQGRGGDSFLIQGLRGGRRQLQAPAGDSVLVSLLRNAGAHVWRGKGPLRKEGPYPTPSTGKPVSRRTCSAAASSSAGDRADT